MGQEVDVQIGFDRFCRGGGLSGWIWSEIAKNVGRVFGTTCHLSGDHMLENRQKACFSVTFADDNFISVY